MPRGDGTGPMGYGPMTGRGVGFCTGFVAPRFANRGFGRGLGLRRIFGRSSYYRFPAYGRRRSRLL